MENNLLSPQLSFLGGLHLNLTFNVHTTPSTPAIPAPHPERIQFNIADPVKSFTGREQNLKELHEAVEGNKSTGNDTVDSQITVITGIGGLGKTQTACKYVLDHKGEYGHMVWINAEKYSQAKDCFKAIASLCNIPSKTFDSRRAEIVDQIFEILCTGEKPCLIVFDNAESMGTTKSGEGIKSFLPASIKPGWQKPVILVTSRYPVWEGAGLVIPLSGLSDKECFALLSAHLEFTDTPENRECAKRIADMCEGLPLVLQQVVAIIRVTNRKNQSLGKSAFTMQDFLSEFEGGGGDFTHWVPADCPVGFTAFQIFKMAFKRIRNDQQNGGIAFRCLSVMAFLNPDNIPAELVTSLSAPIITNETTLTVALNMLQDQNLVTLLNGSYRIHRIVQLVSILYNNQKCETGKTGSLKSKAKGIGKAISGKSKFCFTSSYILTSIIQPFLEYLEKIPLKEEESLNKVLQNGLQIASHLKKHSKVKGTISFLTALANKFDRAGKYSEAETIWKDVLAIYAREERSSAEKWRAKSKLAWACLQQGQHDKALKMFKEVLEIKESELGTNHEKTLSTKADMAVVYYRQEKYGDAIELLEYVLKNEKIKFGSNDSRTTVTKYNLAAALEESGKYERAIELYNDVIEYKQRQLGPNHRSILFAKCNLAEILRKMGKYDEAVKMLEYTLRMRESELGRNHRDTLRTKTSLATALRHKGEYGRAIELYKEVLNFQESYYGENGWETLKTKLGLANVFTKIGNYGVAMEIYQQVLEYRVNSLETNHPDTLWTKQNMAWNLRKQGRYDEALRACEDILDSLQQAPDVIHSRTMSIKAEIARIYACQGKYEDAVELFREVLVNYTKTLGPKHPATKNCEQRLREALERKASCLERLRRNVTRSRCHHFCLIIAILCAGAAVSCTLIRNTVSNFMQESKIAPE